MKRTSFRRAALLACVALTAGMTLASCEKENYGGTIRLNAEKLSGDGKTYVEGVDMGWVNGDLIKFNATTCTVSNGAATGIPEDVDLIAFYPNTISSATAPSNSVSVTVPSEYTYSYSDGHQILALPMVGKASSGDESITMKHLCSAMQITINNSFGEGLVLDSIILRRSGLSGSTTVDLSGSDPEPGAGDVDSVRMAFSDITIAANGGSLTVQIPVLPVAEGTATRVSVRGHLATAGTAYRYSRSTSIALGRAMVHAAPVTMTTPAQGNHMEEIVVSTVPEGAINGRFTVDQYGKQVYFSKGNLQYNTETGQFSFMYPQYSTSEYNDLDVGENYTEQNIVSLFGWGAWRTGNNPRNTSDDESAYLSWGSSEPIGGWRTLTQAEWAYLLNPNSRTTTSGVLYAKATVNGVNGLIILPDDWSTTYYTLNSPNTANADYTTNNNISITTWTNSLEAHGAVFLPAAGYRDGTDVYNVGSCGTYWSSTPEEEEYGAYDMYFGAPGGGIHNLNTDNYDDRFFGQSVRLVQDAN